MKAYMIVVAMVHDREKFIADYASATTQLIEKFDGKYLLLARGAQLLEGEFGDGAGIVISEWPNKEKLMKFWQSPEYAALKTARKDLADCQVLIVESDMLGN